MATEHPTALLRPAPRGRLAFLVVLMLAVSACAALLWWRAGQGVDIIILARNAHGLEVNDPVRYRGIDIGRVADLQLDAQREHVRIAAVLDPDHADCARAGSRFWIEHPRIDWERIGGLDTLIGTRYLACNPGSGPAARRFVALAEPPVDVPAGALPIRLQATDQDGLHRGAPISHRGLVIGRISAVGLSSDARWVEAEAHIEAPYRHLALTSSRFGPAGGIEVEAGLTGVGLRLPPLAQLGLGGVRLVNTGGGEAAGPGHRYRLVERSELDELAGQAPVAIGRELPTLPPVYQARLEWTQPRSYWWDGSGSRTGLAVPFRDGLLLPASLTRAPAAATGVRLQLEGASEPVDPERTQPVSPGLVYLIGLDSAPGPAWRAPGPVEDCQIRIHSGRALPVAAASLLDGDDGWHLPADFPITLLDRGAPVLAGGDGALIGLVDAEPWRVLPLTAEAD